MHTHVQLHASAVTLQAVCARQEHELCSALRLAFQMATLAPQEVRETARAAS